VTPQFGFGINPLGGAKQVADAESMLAAVGDAARAHNLHVVVYDVRDLGQKFTYFVGETAFAAVSDDMTVIESVGAWSPKLAADFADGVNAATRYTGGTAKLFATEDGSPYAITYSVAAGSQLIFGSDGVIVQVLVRPGSAAAESKDEGLIDAMTTMRAAAVVEGDADSPSAGDLRAG